MQMQWLDFRRGIVTLVVGSFVLALAGSAQALEFDQNVTPDVIFGDGNDNGSFTTDTSAGGVELGLRAKLRFNDLNAPENTFNSNGDGTYTFDAGLPPTGFGFAPGSPSTAVWNFEWTINTNIDGTPGGLMLDDLTYEIRIDSDAIGTSFLTFDPINSGLADHAIGDNSTLNGDGVSAADAADYALLISTKNVAQNSWNMEFFFDDPAFNGNDVGSYTIQLEAFAAGASVASTSIIVNSVAIPEPSAALLAGLALLLTGAAARRR
jgi:hypothetical protein